MKNAHNYFVYILLGDDGNYYTGITNNMERRLWEYNHYNKDTDDEQSKARVELRYCESYKDVKQAIAWEKQIKDWPSVKKETLFKDDWDEIVRLAQFKALQ